ncbi:DNA mismatch repair protein Mlh3 isoform X2 [Hemicordylus capensis]|uniref:DNA mismatch repair protein Mlh3 isoform X2 n=1 Tax=Hemicordylus capensis TaxID=884348 RepID=UPI002302836D|nr:DNA mismatch repair protein Mlh3 isoform X2 [Hemicordylus capensis]
MIRCLAEEVQASLRSGVAISSLGQCVEELVLNSLDANATCVAIRVDPETFKVQVVDNGSGMGKEDLNKVGNRYFTSKCCSVEDLENLKCYGFRGEALASLASMASVLEISSKTSKIAKSFVKLFHNGKGLEVSETELNRPSAGTTVTVYNVFHRLPVRRKCMDSILEFERVRHKVEALSLMHPSISFSLRNDASCSMVLQLPKTKDTCSRFSQIYGLGKSQKLREINYKSGGFEISGFISSEGHYNKNIQFLFVNSRLVLKTRLHKLIDFLLRKQSVMCKSKSGPVTSSPARHRSGPELYGIFVINVKCQHDEYDVCLEPAKTLIEFRNWDALLACIEEGVKAFLKREQLFIELCSEDIKELNENNGFCLGNAVALQPSLPEEKGMQENFKRACDNIVDSYEMFNLQSKSVRRKITLAKTSDHLGPTNNVEGAEIHSDLTVTESVNDLSSNQKECLLPNKNGSTLDSPKLSDLHQQPEMFDHPQTEVMSSKCPADPCGQDKSVIEMDNPAATALFTEKYGKDANIQQDRALQESSPNTVTLGDTLELVKDINECKYDFLLGRTLEKHKGMKEGKEPFIGSNTSREVVMEQEPLKLCSTGLITHVMQNQPLPKTTEINHSSDRQFILGPVSAKDIFETKSGLSEHTPDTQECLRITNARICIADEWMETLNVSGQKNESSSLPAGGSVNFVIPHVKELISAVPSGSVHNADGAAWSRQMAELPARPRYCASTKLSLHPKLGSLDRFRRCYGHTKSTQCDVEKRNEVGAPVCVESLTDGEKDVQHSSFCETLTQEYVLPNNSDCDNLLSLEKSRLSIEESPLSIKAFNVRENPLSLTDFQAGKKALCSTKFRGTLASKVSRMKESLKEVLSTKPPGQLSEQSQAHSNHEEEDRQDLPHQNNVLQSTCQILQSFSREVGTESCTSDELGNPLVISSTITGGVESTVSISHCFMDTDGEYIVSQNRSLALPNEEGCSEGSCKDTDVMDRSSKQAYELPSVSLSSNMEGATDSAPGDEELSCPEWLHQFDVSLGKMVYINKMTGLSTYSTPPSEEPQAACIKDISTMAVNVVMESGAQGESLQSLFSEWENPVFAHYPEVAVDVSSGQADSISVKIHNILYPYRFTKKMIDSVQVLDQVDNKFIACLINTRADENRDMDGNLLVLVDQHAAHERVRLEQLITESYEKQPDASGKKKLLASIVCPPMEIEITEEQRRFLWCCHKSLEDFGLEISFPENSPSQILVEKVPLCFVEREANELRRGRQTVTKNIVQEFIREQVELLQTTGGARGTLPLTILKVLASQACHGAIKFNDSLTLEESCRLMEALSLCQLPFQCAHGRPSMLPLADVDHLQQEGQLKPNLAKLKRMAKAWQLFGKEKDPTVKVWTRSQNFSKQ